MAKATKEVKKEVSVHADPPPAIVSEPKDYEYETGDQLGKGGFAICHRATVLEKGKRTGRIVALKIVKAHMEPAKLAQKFVTELQLHSKLDHPNIVEFHRAFSFQTSTYVVLEICDNGSLADAIKKRKYFTMPEIRRFIIQTCGAVKYLHARNIVHRDLKTGNLFLDKDMNIKVGDFGLAALLVNEHDIGKRRTTMCGTPNYLAPEILEKSGKGHNEKVDLWSIGIIAFTLAVGKAPFHAAKREDIYKKLQARDYSWPDLSTSPNEISNDLHSLVSSLLVHEDDRPNPDQIVSHPFFKMTFIPEKLSSSCTKVVPKWPDIKPPNAQTVRRGYSEAWYKLCQASGVGEYAPGKTFQMFGKKVRSVVRECEKEVLAGRQPEVPMPLGMVYVPFRDRKPEQKQAGLSRIVEDKEPSPPEKVLTETTANDRAAAPRRALSKRKRNVATVENPSDTPELVEIVVNEQTKERPQRLRKPSGATATVASRVEPALTTARSSSSSKGPVDEACTRPTNARSSSETVPRSVAARESSDIGRRTVHLTSAATKAAPRRVDSGTAFVATTASAAATARAILVVDSDSERERDPIPDSTSPASVLARVARFRDQLQSALSTRTATARSTVRPSKMPFVTKWVDYARKHGIGYVLDDGSVGISINETSSHPIVHVVVKDGLTHLRQVVQRPSLLEKLPMEAYEDRGERGLMAIRLEGRRREHAAVLWARFGKYMCQVSGDDETVIGNGSKDDLAVFVRFYQRIAGVGIWGFSDGCFQLNFPDHTKIVLSSDGKHCDFTYLKASALAHMKKYGDLPLKLMNERAVVSRSVEALLSASSEDSPEGSIARSNSLRAKLMFIVGMADDWLANGGLGCSSPAVEQLAWTDSKVLPASSQRKKDAVTLGRYGGDAHIVAVA